MDSTNTLPLIEEGSNAVDAINESFDAASPSMLYGRDAGGCDGLVWAYLGGRWGGLLVPSDNETLGTSTTTYMVVDKSDATVSFSTSTTNWNNSTDYARAYKIVTGTTAVTSYEDHRGGPGGVNYGGSAGGGGSTDYRYDVTALSTSGSVAVDYADGDYFTLALAGNVSSFTFSNLPGSGKAASLVIRITQDSTPRTVGWPASFKWAGGSAGSVSTGSGDVDMLAITTFDNGTTWLATLAKDFS